MNTQEKDDEDCFKQKKIKYTVYSEYIENNETTTENAGKTIINVEPPTENNEKTIENNEKTIENNEKTIENKSENFKIRNFIIVEETIKLNYDITSNTNIFTRHYAYLKCPFCSQRFNEYISIGYDNPPKKIEFNPENLLMHLRKHENIISIKESKVITKTQNCEIVILKKIIL